MIQSRFSIEIKEGAKVDLLFALSLFEVARQRGMRLELGADATWKEEMDYFVRFFHCAAIVAWEYRQFDSPEIGEYPYTLLDMAEWATSNPKGFADLIRKGCASIAGTTTAADGDEVKKK